MSSHSKRLQTIKGTPYLITCDVLQKDFHWLVNQVEELEEQLKYEKMTRVGMDSIEQYMNDIKKENKRYKEALKFYADRGNYINDHDDILGELPSVIDFDEGEIASKALKELQ